MIKTAALLMIAFGLVPSPLQQDQSPPKVIPRCTNTSDPEEYAPAKMIRPRYPKDALRNGTAGAVSVRAVVASEGKIKDLTVVSGSGEFSENAVAAIRKWHFRPVAVQGRFVETSYLVHVRFNPLLKEANSDIELESPKASQLLDASPAQPGLVHPKATYAPEPEFSEEARKAGIGGTVRIAMLVDTDGHPETVTLLCGAEPSLNAKAVETAKLWRFEPATRDGKPVRAEVEIETSFKLYH